LAEPEGGRAKGWKAFNAVFDALAFSEAAEAEADQAALDAFSRLHVLLQYTYAAECNVSA
jgi:heme oxygenase